MGSDPPQSLLGRVSALAAGLRRRQPTPPVPSDAPGSPEPVHADLPETRPGGILLWCHGRSAEDLAPVEALIPHLAEILGEPITALATTSASPASLLRTQTLHMPSLPDTSAAADRFLSKWRPDLGVVAGAEVPAALMQATVARGVPLFWVNATWSRPTGRWRAWAADAPIDRFSRVFPATGRDVQQLQHSEVPADRIDARGPLREMPLALPCNEVERIAFARRLASRPVWLAAAVGGSSVEDVSAAHRHASRMSHRLLLVAVPDDAQDGATLAQRFEADGWAVALRSAGDRPDAETQVFVADVPGEMGLWYRLSPVTFLAATLSPGGQGPSPFEPAALGSAVIHGPYTGSHGPRFERLSLAGASRPIAAGQDLGAAIAELLAPDKTAALAEAAWRVTSEGADVADRVLDALATSIETGRGAA
jgi:3-deoxy-D-manno-octulosonic-acid transferase